jgi:hypothetical protein
MRVVAKLLWQPIFGRQPAYQRQRVFIASAEIDACYLTGSVHMGPTVPTRVGVNLKQSNFVRVDCDDSSYLADVGVNIFAVDSYDWKSAACCGQ